MSVLTEQNSTHTPAALTKAQARLLIFCAKRPQQPPRNCRTTRRVVDMGLASWSKAVIGCGQTAVTVDQVELTEVGRAVVAKAVQS